MVSPEDGHWRGRRRLQGRAEFPEKEGGDRRSLCPLFVYLCKGLMVDARDEQGLLMRRLATVDPGEVRLGSVERERHAEGVEQAAHVAGSPGDLEPGEVELDLADTQSRQAVLEHLRGERLLEVAKPILPVWKQHEHREVVAPVVQMYSLVSLGLHVQNLFALVHQRRARRTN